LINQINSNQGYSTGSVQSAKQTGKTETTTETSEVQQTSLKNDTVKIGSKQETSVTYSNIYGKKKLDATDIEALQKEASKTTEQLRELVEKLILKQNDNKKVSDTSSKSNTLTLEDLGITPEDVEQAQAAVSEDGEYGVKAVSDRLVEFAKAISGGDKSKLDELVSAIDKGFAAAKDTLGGELPDISSQTYDETMRKLNEWASSED